MAGLLQGKVFSTPTIIISDALGGIEDIPEGVTAVLSSSIVDVLSHIAIRARNQVKFQIGLQTLCFVAASFQFTDPISKSRRLCFLGSNMHSPSCQAA